MLWDLIRDFFVQHVFGGWTSEGVAYNGIVNGEGGDGVNDFIFQLPLGVTYDGAGQPIYTYMPIGLGDWLSTTATIISISIIVVLCCLFVYKIIKLIGGLIR